MDNGSGGPDGGHRRTRVWIRTGDSAIAAANAASAPSAARDAACAACGRDRTGSLGGPPQARARRPGDSDGPVTAAESESKPVDPGAQVLLELDPAARAVRQGPGAPRVPRARAEPGRSRHRRVTLVGT